MPLDEKQKTVLRRALALTRDEEMDCDAFEEQLAAYVDGNVTDEQVCALIEHHREMCPECDEELQILRRALGKDGDQ